MTKLNFNRPYFRYIDNLRRELRRQVDGYGPHADSTRKPDDAIRLSNLEARVALYLMDALGAYIDASSDLIHAIAPGGKGRYGSARKRRDEAKTELLTVAKRVFVQMLLSKNEGDSNFIEWYQDLGQRLDGVGGGAAWDILNNFAMKEAAEAVEKILQVR